MIKYVCQQCGDPILDDDPVIDECPCGGNYGTPPGPLVPATEPKRRGPPKGHPPYRPKVQTEKIHLSLTPELKARIEADATAKGLTVNKWLRLAAEAVLNA